MKPKSDIRIISIILGIGVFIFSAYLTLSIALYILGFSASGSFFALGRILYSSYGISSLFIPLILLYAAVLLIIPGWQAYSKALLAGSPVYFFSLVLGEKFIYFLLPHIGNGIVQEFTKVAVFICTVLAVLFEVFMVLNIAEKRPQRRAFMSAGEWEDEDIVGGELYCDERFNAEPFTMSSDTQAADMDRLDEGALKNAAQALAAFGRRGAAPDEGAQSKTGGAEETVKPSAKRGIINSLVVIETPKPEEPSVLEEYGEYGTGRKVNSAIADTDKNSAAYAEDGEPLDAVFEEAETEEAGGQGTAGDGNEGLGNDGNAESGFYDEPLSEDGFADDEDDADSAYDEAETGDFDEDDFNEDDFDEGSFDDELEADKDPLTGGFYDAQETEDGFDEGSFDDSTEEGGFEDEFEDDAEEDFTEDSFTEDGAETAEAGMAEVTQAGGLNVRMQPEGAAVQAAGLPIEITAAKPLQPKVQEIKRNYYIPFDLLTNYPGNDYWIIDDSTRTAAIALKNTFEEFNINIEITGIRKGPVVTMFEVLPPPGIKLGKITALQDNIALRLAAQSVRIVAPIPGKQAVGIEVPNKSRAIVGFRELIETEIPETNKMAIPIVLGKDVTGEPQTLDLCQTPHLLIAGATGSGKSVCVNSIILSILYNKSPEEVKLLLVDPKIVELKLYNGIGHLLTPVITEPKRALQGLQYCICEMERRYAMLDGMSVRDIKSYNKKIRREKIAAEALPYIVIIIDEFADLMATTGKELEATVSRLCAMSRAVGIHLVLATQRPSTNVITGLIKANIPSRIAFMVASRVDSQIILDNNGAEKLLGKGDMLYVSTVNPFPGRIQGTFVSDEEVEKVVECVKTFGEPEYIDDEIFFDEDDYGQDTLFDEESDPLYDEALEIVMQEGKASASYIQRKLKIGYNRAARIVEEMEARGVVGPANGSKPREVISPV